MNNSPKKVNIIFFNSIAINEVVLRLSRTLKYYTLTNSKKKNA